MSVANRPFHGDIPHVDSDFRACVPGKRDHDTRLSFKDPLRSEHWHGHTWVEASLFVGTSSVGVFNDVRADSKIVRPLHSSATAGIGTTKRPPHVLTTAICSATSSLMF